jgi:hypothetical protein
MNESLPPNEAISPELTEDRLQIIGRIIADARREKLSFRQPQDTPWNLSCDCYMWAWYALREAGEGEHSDWLFIPGKHGDLTTCFYIGGKTGIPSKFYRADAPGQPERTARAGVAERAALDVMQIEMMLPGFEPIPDEFEEDPLAPVVRFAFTYAADLSAVSLELQQLDAEGEITYKWPILLNEDEQVLPFTAGGAAPVELSEPPVELVNEKEAREEAERLAAELAAIRAREEAERKAQDKKKGA